MRLKKQREDVAYLKKCTHFEADDVRIIAARYHRLILAVECGLRQREGQGWGPEELPIQVKRVIKDGEIKCD